MADRDQQLRPPVGHGIQRRLVWLRKHRPQRSLATRRRAARALATGSICVEVAGPVGLGGSLRRAAEALQIGQRTHTEVALAFTAENYRPHGWTGGDWLECYFIRLGPVCSPDSVHVEVGDLPLKPVEPSVASPLVWSAIAIRPEIRATAAPFMVGRYAAVHFRGSDKYRARPWVAPRLLLDRVEHEMSQAGLDRVLAASDEAGFLGAARKRFGSAVFVVPQQVFAVAGRPPHFANVPGEIKAREALTTMLVLSGAELVVQTKSLFSFWAHTLAAPSQQQVVVTAAG